MQDRSKSSSDRSSQTITVRRLSKHVTVGKATAAQSAGSLLSLLRHTCWRQGRERTKHRWWVEVQLLSLSERDTLKEERKVSSSGTREGATGVASSLTLSLF